MRFKSGITFSLLWLLAIALVLPHCAWAKAEKVTLQLGRQHQFQFAGYYAAKEKGFYKEAGLEVAIREGLPSIDHVEEMLSGRADYLTYHPGALIYRAQGEPIIALASIFQKSPRVIVTRKDSGIDSPMDLIGQQSMFTKLDLELLTMLSKEGLNPSKIQMVPHSYDQHDLIEGRVDAMSVYMTDAPYHFKQEGVEINYIKPQSFGVNFYGDSLFTTEAEVSEHPTRVEAFRTASLKGWEYALENPQEIIDLLLHKYKSRFSRDELKYESNATRSLIRPDLVQIGHINSERWRQIANDLIALKLLPKELDINEFLYTPLAQRQGMVSSQTTERLELALKGFIAAIISLFILNRYLQKRVQKKTAELSALNQTLKRKEQDLQAKEELLTATFEAVPDGLCVTDSERNVIMVNQGAATLAGAPKGEIIGRPVHDFFSSSEDYLRVGAIRKEQETEKTSPHTYTVDYIRSDGSVFSGETTGTPILNQNGQSIGYLAVVRDITQQKKVS
ncbi:MAG: ABC transporter substrate-binding protein, partial [Desulfuromonadales bacterium]|nr:ABC transporter substrate-binding protein [Desulfuromonadales bacterium]